jgi:hypothetical protein
MDSFPQFDLAGQTALVSGAARGLLKGRFVNHGDLPAQESDEVPDWRGFERLAPVEHCHA